MVSFDYFYGQEAEQFSFFRIPKLLITEPAFSGLSDSAKIMYGLFLDRTALSQKNGWYDDQNRSYVICSVEEIMEALGCGNQKVTKVLAELDSKKGMGLIERIRRGFGRPDIIYVKNFSSIINKTSPTTETKEDRTSKSLKTPENIASAEKCENYISRDVKITSLTCENHISEDVKTTPLNINNTDLNNTDDRKTNKSDAPLARAPLPSPEKKEEKEENSPDDDPHMTSIVKKRVQWLSQEEDAIPLTPREKEMFDLFIAERKKRGKSTSRVQRNMLIQQLYLLGSDELTRIGILEKTIAKGRNDIYPLDDGAGSP